MVSLKYTLNDYLSGRLSLPGLYHLLEGNQENTKLVLQTLKEFEDAGKLPTELYQKLRQHYLISRTASSVTPPQQDATQLATRQPAWARPGMVDQETSLALPAQETRLQQEDNTLGSSMVGTDTTLRILPSTPYRAGGVGQMLNGRFVLENVIARGGMGVIYKARDLRKEEARDRDPFVAVKVLNEDFAVHFPDAFIALQREAKKAQKLAHPNIVTVYDFDRDGDTVYITMELLEGEPLSKLLKRSPADGFPVCEAMPIIRAIGEGLAYAHKKGIVHADLKPDNVFLIANGEVKLLDMGIARALIRPGESDMTTTVFDPQMLGALTPSYASPEMFETESKPDPRDDIYALSCVAYELLAGRHPFGKCPAHEARKSGLQPNRIKKLSKQQWRALIHGLAFDREARTSSVEAFLKELGYVEKTKRLMTRSELWGGLGLGLLVLVAILLLYRPSGVLAPDGERWLPADTDTRHNEILAHPAQEPAEATREQEIARLLSEAQARLRNGQLTEPEGHSALASYRQVLSLDSGNADAIAGLVQIARHYTTEAQIYRQTKAWKQGLTEVARGLLARPKDPELLALQSQMREQQAEETQVEEYISVLLTNAEEQRRGLRLTRPAGDNAYESLQRVLELKPGHPEATAGLRKIADTYQELASANWRKGDIEKATTGIARGLTVDPEHPGLLALQDKVQATQQQVYQHEFNALLREAESLRAKGDWKASLATIEQGLRAQPEHAGLLSLRNRVKADQAEAQRKASLTQQIARLLDEAQQHMRAGRFAEPNGDNALENYRQVLSLDPGNRDAKQGIAQITDHYETSARSYIAAENWTQSLAEIERGLRAQPQHTGLLSLRKQIYAEIEALRQPQKRNKLRTFGTF